MSTTPDFTTMAYDTEFPAHGFDEWEAAAEKASGKTLEEMISWTMEHVDVKPLYTQAGLEGLGHLGYVVGIPPYLRGPYPRVVCSISCFN